MFGMAMKFLELNLEPLNILRSSDVSNRQTEQTAFEPQRSKRPSKSSQNIKDYTNQKAIAQVPDFFEDKENALKEKLQQSRLRTENLSQMNIEELKSSQQQVLDEFKRSISQSLAEHGMNQSNSEESVQISKSISPSAVKKQVDRYQKIGGLVLSKIEELSEEYLEYSIRKQEFVHNLNGGSAKSFEAIEHKSKGLSCELIKSIVKSVLLDDNQNNLLSNSDLKKSDLKKEFSHEKFDTNRQSEKIPEKNENVTSFIKDLFVSLGLINEKQLESDTLNEIIATAKKNFNQLKGQHYVQKLNEMLHSVEQIDQKSNPLNPLGLSTSIKVSHLYNPQNEIRELGYSKNLEEKPRSILIKKDEDKKVKLVSPQTESQLQNKRNFIEGQILGAMQFLTKTRRAKKYAFGSLGVKQVQLNFSMDFRFMSFKQAKQSLFSRSAFGKFISSLCSCRKAQFNEIEEKDEQKMTMLSLKWNLVNVSKGIKTKNFIKHEEAKENANKSGLYEDRCLSLLFKNRTYDFEFENNQVRDEYFRAIKMMIKSSFELE